MNTEQFLKIATDAVIQEAHKHYPHDDINNVCSLPVLKSGGNNIVIVYGVGYSKQENEIKFSNEPKDGFINLLDTDEVITEAIQYHIWDAFYDYAYWAQSAESFDLSNSGDTE